MICFGDRLHEIVRRAGYEDSNSRLARDMKVSRTLLQTWLNAISPPTQKSIARLARFFQLPAEAFIDGVRPSSMPRPADRSVDQYWAARPPSATTKTKTAS